MPLSIYVRAFVDYPADATFLATVLREGVPGRVKYVHAWHEHLGVNFALETECAQTTPQGVVAAVRCLLADHHGDASAYALDSLLGDDVAMAEWSPPKRRKVAR